MGLQKILGLSALLFLIVLGTAVAHSDINGDNSVDKSGQCSMHESNGHMSFMSQDMNSHGFMSWMKNKMGFMWS